MHTTLTRHLCCRSVVAGVLLANRTAFISPAIMHWTRSGDLIVMAVLGGMGSGTNVELVAAVSQAGGLGVLGCSGDPADAIRQSAEAIRARTPKPFGMNLLLFLIGQRIAPEAVDALIESGGRHAHP